MANLDSVPPAADQFLNAELPRDLDGEAATLGSILLMPCSVTQSHRAVH